MHIFKIHFMLGFGLLANFLHLVIGFIPYLENYDLVNDQMKKEVNIDLTQILFLTMIFFSIFFGIYSLFCLNLT